MELELLEILPNGRKIYLRPKNNRSAVKQAAIKINNTWREFGKKDLELKPLFQDQAGKLHEIEAGGEDFKTADNPKGYKFTNYVNHLKRNLLRSSRDKSAIVKLSEVEEATRQVFPDLSKKENKLFARALYDFNEQEIGRILASRKTTESTDHVRSLAKGGLNWFSNLLNIETEINLKKGAKDLPDASYKDINNPASRIETIKASLSNDRIKGNPKYKANVIASYFKGETAKKIEKGDIRGETFAFLDKVSFDDDLKVQGDGTAVLADEARKVNWNKLADLGNTNVAKQFTSNFGSAVSPSGVATNIALNPSLMKQIGARVHKGKPINWKGFGKELGKDIAWDTVFGGVTLTALKKLGPLAPALMVKPIYSAADAYVEGATGKSITDRYEQYREDKAPFSEKRIAESGLIPKYIDPNTESGVAEIKQYDPWKDMDMWTP